jgi:predicted RNA binding protein YcfA (HicA-like mRNA interferase family)
MNYTEIPAISGEQLLKLLEKDSWELGRKTTHGISIKKYIKGHWKVAIIPKTGASLPIGTLSAILGSKQTGIGKKGLLELLNKYGL